MADRFTYLPQIGLCIALAWGSGRLCRSWPYRRWVCGVASALVLAVLMGCAWRQTSFWRDSETLWTHALACTSRNIMAHTNLGDAPGRAGRVDEAMAHYREGPGNQARLRRGPQQPWRSSGRPWAGSTRPSPITAKALEIQARYAEAHNNLGRLLARPDRFDEAIAPLSEGPGNQARLCRGPQQPGHTPWLAAGPACGRGYPHYQKALEIEPDYARAHNNLANAWLGGADSTRHCPLSEGVEIRPDYAEAPQQPWAPSWPPGPVRRGIATVPKGGANPARRRGSAEESGLAAGDLPAGVAAKRRRGDRACPTGRPALWQQRPDVLDTLAAAYAEAGRFPEALATARKALELATQQNNRALADALRAHIALYEAGKPYHQPPRLRRPRRRNLELPPQASAPTGRPVFAGDPDGIRTRVAGVKGLCPRPLDDGAKQDPSVYLYAAAGVKGSLGKPVADMAPCEQIDGGRGKSRRRSGTERNRGQSGARDRGQREKVG